MITTSLVSLFLFLGITAASDLSDVSAAWGGELNDRDGILISPGRSPSPAGPEHWEWLLRGEPGKRKTLRFLTFDLPSSAHCQKAYVEIRDVKDDTGSVLLGRYCGNNVPAVLAASPGASLKIIFHTDGSPWHGTGFRVHYGNDEETCGFFTADRGTLSWPNATENHRDECEWVINTQPDKSTSFELEILSTTKNPDCQRDYYELTMHVLYKYPARIRPCNRKTTWILQSPGPTTKIALRPRGTATLADVRLRFSTVENMAHQGPLIRDDEANRFTVIYGAGDYYGRNERTSGVDGNSNG